MVINSITTLLAMMVSKIDEIIKILNFKGTRGEITMSEKYKRNIMSTYFNITMYTLKPLNWLYCFSRFKNVG